MPWETAAGPPDIQVTCNGAASNVETVTITASASSAFLSDLTSGMAWVNGSGV